ncbi:MAG: hypothetical protein GY720_18875 [bacterium]|nr:hypothetical protein [bacterium]
MDSHQRLNWSRMLKRINDYRGGTISLGKLIDDLRGLYDAADIHDGDIRSDFESYWSPIDGEHELRTEPWVPPGLASDERLTELLDEFSRWVGEVLESADDNHG